jgi:hypothetical protein
MDPPEEMRMAAMASNRKALKEFITGINTSDDGRVKVTVVADMSEKREKAKTPITVQREHVHEAVAGQEDAEQDGRDDHAAAASQDRGDGAAEVLDEGIQTRPRKPPDAGCLKPRRVGPGLMEPGPILVNPGGDDDELNDIENEFVYMEGDTMADEGGGMANDDDGRGGVRVPVQVDAHV